MKHRLILFVTHPVFIVIVALIVLTPVLLLLAAAAFDDSIPTLSNPRFWTSVVLLLIFAVVMRKVWKYCSGKRDDARRAEKASKEQQKALTEEERNRKKREENRVEMHKAIRLSIRTLRTERLSKSTGIHAWRNYLSLIGSRYLYERPWYLLVGAPDSGKSSALSNLGGRFPLQRELFAKKFKNLGPTTLADFWISEHAVLVDTGGHLTTQSGGDENHADAWETLLKLLRKNRSRQPINGVLLTVSVTDLLEKNQEKRDELALSLRNRLTEVSEQLGVRAPVYLILTKSDLLAGFDEFFMDLSVEQREQAWGVTLPSRVETEAERGAQRGKLLQELHERLGSISLSRIGAETDRKDIGKIFAFPQQFGALIPVLSRFIDSACGGGESDDPLVRGIYFTSATQEGTPIDQLRAAIGREFRISVLSEQRSPGVGRGYFLARLLRDVFVLEKNLGGLSARKARRHSVGRAFAVGGLYAIGIVCIGAWLISSWKNYGYVRSVAANVAALNDDLKKGGYAARGDDLLNASTLLDRVRTVANTAEVTPLEASGLYKAGLFQGGKLFEATSTTYGRLLPRLLLPPIIRDIEGILSSSAKGAESDRIYEALRAYLMLYEPGHFDGKIFSEWVDNQWQRTLTQDVGESQRRALREHLAAFVRLNVRTPDQVRNNDLVQQAQSYLAQTNIADRIYGKLKRESIPDDLQPFTLAGAGGPAAPQVFTRASKAPLTAGIPALFTYKGYHSVFKPKIGPEAERYVSEEPWVLGTTKVAQDPRQIASSVRSLYITDYIAQWDRFLADVRLLPLKVGSSDAVGLARLLAQKDGPLVRLLQGVSTETRLYIPQDKGSGTIVNPIPDAQSHGPVGRWIRDISRTIRMLILTQRDIRQLQSATEQGLDKSVLPNDGAEKGVNERYDAIAKLVAGERPPFNEVRELLTELNVQLVAVETAKNDGGAAVPKTGEVFDKLRAKAGDLPPVVRAMIMSLVEGGVAQSKAAASEKAGQEFAASIAPQCDMVVANRYPFVRVSSRDSPRDDFVKLFGPGRVLDQYFQKHPEIATEISSPKFQIFKRFEAIRDAFFPGSAPVPTIGFKMKLISLKEGVREVTLDLDGKLHSFPSKDGKATSMAWPGTEGGIGLRVSATGANGPIGKAIQIESPWAVWRLMDRAEIRPGDSPESFQANFEELGIGALFEVTTHTAKNPFRLEELNRFSCAGLKGA